MWTVLFLCLRNILSGSHKASAGRQDFDVFNDLYSFGKQILKECLAHLQLIITQNVKGLSPIFKAMKYFVRTNVWPLQNSSSHAV